MILSAKLAPPNSLVLVKDLGDADIPRSMSNSLIVSTNSCVAVGCLSELDGDTNFTLGPTREVDPGYPSKFEGMVATPSRQIVLQSVLGEIVLEQLVPEFETRIRIWVNDANEPDSVIVGID